MLSILHISDLHFGPPYVSRVGRALLNAAPGLALDVIVASGDFTQRARPEQFQQARAFLDELPQVPTVVVPGNHDVPLYRFYERLVNPYRYYREYISSDVDQVVHVDGACLVALNSTAPYRAITNGRIDSRQLALCAEVFSKVPAEAVKIVVAHHHFAPAPDYERSQTMPRARRALDRFQELEVDLILGGHLHRAYIGNSLDIYAGKHRERGITIVQCGTTTSRRGRAREREKNSFNLLKIDSETIAVTHYMYFSENDQFAPVGRHLFPRRHIPYLSVP